MSKPWIFEDSLTAKAFRRSLNLNDLAKVLTGDDDPTSVAQDAPQGSVYMRTGASGGSFFLKQDAGSSTNWTAVQVGVPAAATTKTGPENVGVTLSAGTFTVTQANGNAISSNVSFVNIQSQAQIGEVVRLAIDNAITHTFDDAAGTSDIIGEQFGKTTGIASGNDSPFYLYAVNSNDTSAGMRFAISPNPAARSSPATANIGFHGNPASTPSDVNFFFLTSVDVTTTHDAVPCQLIGGIRMQMNASDDWTIQALSDLDGIRPDPYINTWFDFVRGQRGASSNNFLQTNVSAPPTWATPANILYKYHLGLDGQIHIRMSTQGAGNVTNGGGANQIFMALPYDWIDDSINRTQAGIVFYAASGATPTDVGTISWITTDQDTARLTRNNGATLDNNDFTAAGDDLALDFWYSAFES